MAKLTRSSVLFPFSCVLVSFILSSLLIFSGWRKGFLEELALVRLNTKAIADGRPLVIGLNGTVKMDKVSPWVEANASKPLPLHVFQQPAEKPRLPDWFSLHLLTSCHGQYSNGANESEHYHKVECTEPNPIHRLNLNDTLDRARQGNSSRQHANHDDWKVSVEEKLDIFNNATLELFVLYAVGMGCAGLAAVWSVASAFSPTNKALVDINLIVVTTSALSLLIGTIVVTVVGTQGVKDINNASREIGIVARKGNRFVVFSWVSTVLMLFAFGYWTSKYIVLRRRQKWQQQKESF